MGCDIHLILQKKTDEGWETISKKCPFYSNRDYDLFALLAGTKNSSGLKPIDELRGWPQDVQEKYLYYKDYDFHSFTWYLLSELEEYDFEPNGELYKQEKVNLYHLTKIIVRLNEFVNLFKKFIDKYNYEQFIFEKSNNRLQSKDVRILMMFDN